MRDVNFFRRQGPFSLAEVAALAGVTVDTAIAGKLISGIQTLQDAGPDEISFLDNPKYIPYLETCRAAACFMAEKHARKAPEGLILLVTPDPYRAFATALAKFYPDAMRPLSVDNALAGVSPAAHIHPGARLEPGVVAEPGAVVGEGAEIGAGTLIGANAVIGRQVRVGRDCAIGACCSIAHALIGDRVIIHPGVCVGQDGFGFAMGAGGHVKVPQIGRVIIQHDVEIGANTTIDRGALQDTVIGEGSKIDNQVQIGHNVRTGRNCIIVAQNGIAGSVTLEDFVVLGGQVGVRGHVTIGAGAQLAATSAVAEDVPAGQRWGGIPARPFRRWMRELNLLRRMAENADHRERGGGGN